MQYKHLLRATECTPFHETLADLLPCSCRVRAQGRILNVTAGGYAVGVAGYVALLQRQQGSVQQTRRIGVLQDFYIHSMDNKRRRITLSNMQRASDMSDVYRATM
jgi:hypothetical protein